MGKKVDEKGIILSIMTIKGDDDLNEYLKNNIEFVKNIKDEKILNIIFKNIFKLSNVDFIDVYINSNKRTFLSQISIFIFNIMKNTESETKLNINEDNILSICYYFKQIDNILFQTGIKTEEISILHYILIIWTLSLPKIIKENEKNIRFYNDNINKFIIEEENEFEFKCDKHKDLFIHNLIVFTLFNFISITKDSSTNNIFLIWRKLFKTYPKTYPKLKTQKFTEFVNMLPIIYNDFYTIDERLKLYLNGEIISYILNIINTIDDIEFAIKYISKYDNDDAKNLIIELNKLKKEEEDKINKLKKEEEDKIKETEKLLLEELDKEKKDITMEEEKKEKKKKENDEKERNNIIGEIRKTLFKENYDGSIIKFDNFDKIRSENMYTTYKIFGLIIFNYLKDYLIYFISLFQKKYGCILFMLHGGVCIQHYSNKNYKTYDLDYKFMSELHKEYVVQLLSEDFIKFLNDKIEMQNILKRNSESELNVYIKSLKNDCTDFEFVSIIEKDRPIIKVLLNFNHRGYKMNIQLIDIKYESYKKIYDSIKYNVNKSNITINILKKDYMIEQLELYISDYNKLKKLLHKDIENDIYVNSLTEDEKVILKEFKTDNIEKVISEKYEYKLYESIIKYGKKSIEQLKKITSTDGRRKSIKKSRRKSIKKSKRRKSIKKSKRRKSVN